MICLYRQTILGIFRLTGELSSVARFVWWQTIFAAASFASPVSPTISLEQTFLVEAQRRRVYGTRRRGISSHAACYESLLYRCKKYLRKHPCSILNEYCTNTAISNISVVANAPQHPSAYTHIGTYVIVSSITHAVASSNTSRSNTCVVSVVIRSFALVRNYRAPFHLFKLIRPAITSF